MEDVFAAELGLLSAEGAIENTSDAVTLTLRGRAYAPNVYQRFFTNSDLNEAPAGQVTYGVSRWAPPAQTGQARADPSVLAG
jgi:hypothetical protein